ncbi:MAG: DUF2383 domain-containing protein [Halobacteriovoraceae bacterium]|nr:DUF2383 domain-containing protein [Halobacteriovoraceae bacterium]
MLRPENKISEVLIGERSAVEAYENIAEDFPAGAAATRISEMKRNHQEALEFWKKQADREHLDSTSKSGIWGTVVNTVMNVSKKFSEEAALTALKTGEEQGLKYYQNLLSNSDLSPFQKEQIKNKFIPEHQAHIVTLKSLTKVA